MRKLLVTTALATCLPIAMMAAPAYAQDSNAKDAAAQGQKTASSNPCSTRFSKVDSNDNGMVSKSEADKYISESFSTIDANSDGKISKSEYFNCFANNFSMVAPEDKTASKRDESSFKQADANSDGAVDANEYMSASEKAYNSSSKDNGDKAASKDSSKNDSKQASNDNDAGQVVLYRYVWIVPTDAEEKDPASMSQDQAASSARLGFDALDSNSDGKLSKTEWQHSPTSEDNSRAAEARFSKLDANSDGNVTKSEYQNAMDARKNESAKDKDGKQANAAGSGKDDDIPVFYYRVYYY